MLMLTLQPKRDIKASDYSRREHEGIHFKTHLPQMEEVGREMLQHVKCSCLPINSLHITFGATDTPTIPLPHKQGNPMKSPPRAFVTFGPILSTPGAGYLVREGIDLLIDALTTSFSLNSLANEAIDLLIDAPTSGVGLLANERINPPHHLILVPILLGFVWIEWF
ncbi:hypothetical protein BD779DRAFT_165444 [Infundibulicybe gibba]|nr:hypothetical protein BD779DRAFT_165444 [Infundibulicybe gibba]